jgi:hypothetical protein
MIRFIEELSLSALPALETVFLDGWVLRFSNDYTRRANSINPLYAGTRPLAGGAPGLACDRGGGVALRPQGRRCRIKPMTKFEEAARKIEAECPAMRARRASRVLGKVYDDELRWLGLQSSQSGVLVTWPWPEKTGPPSGRWPTSC